jgi:hypothetical protein
MSLVSCFTRPDHHQLTDVTPWIGTFLQGGSHKAALTPGKDEIGDIDGFPKAILGSFSGTPHSN